MINEKDLQVNEFQGQQKKVKQIGNKRPMETGDMQTEKKKFYEKKKTKQKGISMINLRGKKKKEMVRIQTNVNKDEERNQS